MNTATDYNILDFGATGDGVKINTGAFQKAIDTCSRKGGGRVIVPKGTFVTGTFSIRSNVNLFIEQEGVIIGSPYKKDYPDLFADDPLFKRSPHNCLVHSNNAENITISGPGTINGNARMDSTGDYQDTGNNHYRPTLVWLVHSTKVTIQDVTLQQALMYTIVCERCTTVHVNHITIKENYFYNADGCDIIDCTDFLVENCNIDCDDDGICLKSNLPLGCCGGIIRNNKVRSLCNAIKMGTGSSGGFCNITIEDNEVWETGISGLALEIVDGGVMENIRVTNLTMNGVCTPIYIRLGNRNKGVDPALAVLDGILRNVHISGLKARVNKPKKFNEAERAHHNYGVYASSICGIPGVYIENVTIENTDIVLEGGFEPATVQDARREIPEVTNKYPENRMHGILPCWGFYIRHVRGITLRNINISIAQEDGRPALMLDDVHTARFESVRTNSKATVPLFSFNAGCTDLQLD